MSDHNEKSEKLMRAMSEIDEDLIVEARSVRHNRIRLMRWSAIAACFALVAMCTPILVMMLTTVGAGGKAEVEDLDYAETYFEHDNIKEETPKGDVQQSMSNDGNTAWSDILKDLEDIRDKLALEEKLDELEGCTEKADGLCGIPVTDRVELALTKADDRPLELILSILEEIGGNQEFRTISSEGSPDDRVVLYVDGKLVTNLPTAEGSYRLTVDFSALLADERCTVNEHFYISGAGSFTVKPYEKTEE